MSTGHSAPREDGPEQRWRRTVERRGRPAKLKLGRLVRDFGYGELDREAGETIEARLANVGLAVDPRLNAVGVDEVVTLYAPEDRRSTKEPATELQQPRDIAGGHAADEGITLPGPADEPHETDGESALFELVRLGSERRPSVQPAESQPQSVPSPEEALSPGTEPPATDLSEPAAGAVAASRPEERPPEESPLVRAARDTERGMRDALERARQEAESRIAALKVELVAERADAGRLRVEQASLEAQLAGARVAAKRLRVEQASLEQELTASRSETDGLRAERAQLELRYLASAEAEGVARREIEEQRAALADQRREQLRVTEALAASQRALGQAREEVRTTAAEFRRVLGEGTDDGEAGVPNVEVVADEGEAMDEVQGGDASHGRVADSEAPSSVPKVAPVDRPATSGTRAHGGLFSLGSGSRGRWRGSCAVCAQAPESGRRGDLLDAGWALEADMAVCPLCRQAGWQPRPGGGAPFRPFSARPPGS